MRKIIRWGTGSVIAVCLAVAGWSPIVGQAEVEPKVHLSVAHFGWVECAAFNRDGSLAATGSGDVMIWDIRRGVRRTVLRTDHGSVLGLAFHPTKPLLAVAYDDIVLVWDLVSERILHEIRATGAAHGGEMRSVAFGPKGASIAVVHDYGILLWDVAVAKLRWEVEDYSAEGPLAYARDGKTLFIASFSDTSDTSDTLASGTVALRSVSTGERKGELALPKNLGQIGAMDLAASGNALAVAIELNSLWGDGKTEGKTFVWNIVENKLRAVLPSRCAAAVCFAGDDDHLLTIDRDIVLWDIARARPVRKFGSKSAGRYLAGAMDPSGKLLITGSDDHGVGLWNLQRGERLNAWAGIGNVSSLQVAEDGLLVIARNKYLSGYGPGRGQAEVWDVRKPSLTGTISPAVGGVESVALSEDGEELLLGISGSETTPPELVALCQTRSRRRVRGYGASSMGYAKFTGFLNQQKWLFGAEWGGRIAVWDRADGTLLQRFKFVDEQALKKKHRGAPWLPLNAVVPLGNTQKLLLGSAHGIVLVWSAGTNHVDLRAEGSLREIRCADVDPENRRFVVGGQLREGGGGIEFWDSSKGSVLRCVKQEHTVWAVAFSPDGKAIASGDWDGLIVISNAETGAPLAQILTPHRPVTCLEYLNPTRLVSVSPSDFPRVWNVDTGEEIAAFVCTDSGDQWVITTPNGYFACSEEAKKLITMRSGRRLVTSDQWFLRKHRPDLVAAAIWGDP